MNRALGSIGDPRGRVVASRVFAGAAAAESLAILTSKLLIDGAAFTLIWSLALLVLWTARALRRAVRAAVAP